MFQQNREKNQEREHKSEKARMHACKKERKKHKHGVFFELLVKYLIGRKQKLFKQTRHSVLQADNLEKVLYAKAKGLTTNKKAQR